MLKHHLAHFKRFGNSDDGESNSPGIARRPSQKYLAPAQNKDSRIFEVNHAPLSSQSCYDTRDNIVHHTVDIRRLSRSYKGEHGFGVDSNPAYTSGTGKEVVHHTINMRLLSQCYGEDGTAPVKARHHTINMASLLRRYGPAVVSTPALKDRHTRLKLLNLNAHPIESQPAQPPHLPVRRDREAHRAGLPIPVAPHLGQSSAPPRAVRSGAPQLQYPPRCGRHTQWALDTA